jgi:predicted DNA repair protein MutK
LLMLGGSYLAFEATEKIIEVVTGDHHAEDELLEVDTAAELEARQVAGAVRTDFILSAEIMAIALASIEAMSIAMQAGALVLVAIAITVGVYGVVAIIVKLDDIGLHLAAGRAAATRMIGRGLVEGVPKLLATLSAVGTAAMLWVGGGILLHGLEELRLFHALPHTLHDWSIALRGAAGFMGPVLQWLAYAFASAIVGLIIGGIIVVIVRSFTRHPEELIVD